MKDTPRSARGLVGQARPFALTVLVVTAGLTITLAGVRSIADIVGPVFLALVITVTLHPIRLWLERGHLPTWATSLVMLVAAYLVLVLLTLALIVSFAQLAELLPQYTGQLEDGVENAVNTLRHLGVRQEQIDAIVDAIDPGQLIDLALSVLSGTLGVLGSLVFLFTVLLFMAFDTDSTRRSLATLGERFPNPVAALANFARSTRSYMSVCAGFGLVVAVIDGVVLYLMDVQGAFVWGVLAFVTNFIPNIGFVIGVIPPALIALFDSGPDLMIWVIVVYCVINFVIQSVIQPRVVGSTVGLSPLLTFLSLVFWTWVVGPVGALLAVPLTLLTKALLIEADPRTRWALPLIAGTPAASVEPETQAAPAPRRDESSG
jgi:AI-2 transport protein TqsA